MSESCPTCRGRGTLPDIKVCALDDCKREFRWQDDGRGREHPREDAIYCSTSCQNVAGYQHGHAPSGEKNRHTFGGLTDQAFRLIPLLEAGRNADWSF